MASYNIRAVGFWSILSAAPSRPACWSLGMGLWCFEAWSQMTSALWHEERSGAIWKRRCALAAEGIPWFGSFGEASECNYSVLLSRAVMSCPLTLISSSLFASKTFFGRGVTGLHLRGQVFAKMIQTHGRNCPRQRPDATMTRACSQWRKW